MMKRNDYLSSRVLMPSGMRRKNRKEVSALAELELPGNETVAARLREAAERGTLAHALLFTGSGTARRRSQPSSMPAVSSGVGYTSTPRPRKGMAAAFFLASRAEAERR